MQFNTTKIEVVACDPALRNDCKSTEEIAVKVSHLRFMFFFLNTNFDGSNIESPLSGYLDTTNQDKFKLGSTVVRTIPLKANVGFLKDSYYSSSATK